uniref:YopX family protein n=1 Tax=Staphylococcus aureus TaxID=1280 RepID=UPI0020BD676F
MMLKFKAWDKDKKVMSIIDEIDFNSGYILISTGYKSFNEVKLLQYTGFKDVHGVEIYEGDIVQDCYSREVSFITFSNVTELLSENDDIIEIVGNIFENEMLLEVMR